MDRVTLRKLPHFWRVGCTRLPVGFVKKFIQVPSSATRLHLRRVRRKPKKMSNVLVAERDNGFARVEGKLIVGPDRLLGGEAVELPRDIDAYRVLKWVAPWGWGRPWYIVVEWS